MASAGNLPLFPPPAGYVVDLSHPRRNGATGGFWVPGVGMVLSTTFLALRLYTKTFLTRTFGFDDVCLICAWIFSLVVQLLIIYLRANSDIAVHVWEISGDKFNYATNMTTVASILYCPLLAFAKFSILLLYWKLGPIRWFRAAVGISMFIVIGANFALIFAFIFACTPVKRGWDIFITEGSCINHAALFIATAVLNIVTDIILLILPIPIVAKLQMPRIQKIGLCLMFGIGSLTLVTSIVRLVLLIPLLTNPDSTWAVSTPSIWVTVEANLVIICVSSLSMRQFFNRVAPHLMNSGGRGQAHNNDHTGDSSQLQTIGSKTKRVLGTGYGRMGEDEGDCYDTQDAISLKGREEAVVRSISASGGWPLRAGAVAAEGTQREQTFFLESDESIKVTDDAHDSADAQRKGITKQEEFAVEYSQRSSRDFDTRNPAVARRLGLPIVSEY